MSRTYLIVCALALLVMLVETLTGHPGIGSMFAAMLAAPWSMLVAGLAPPLPRDWPMAAGLAVRMLPLAAFMLLNALIVRGIAARSERDLARTVTRVTALLVLTAPLGSGCLLSTRQEVFIAAPTQTLLVFFNGTGGALFRFDLSTMPQWRDQRSKIVRIRDLAILGDFHNATGVFAPGPIDVNIAVAADTLLLLPNSAIAGVVEWGPVHVDTSATQRIDWAQGQSLMHAGASTLDGEIRGDGLFMLHAVTAQSALGGVAVDNLRIAAVFELK